MISYGSQMISYGSQMISYGSQMISYGSPTCSITQRPAIMFCFTESCPQPAFACQPDQIISHNHGINGKNYFWCAILPTTRRAI
jgi:hypothetical protein